MSPASEAIGELLARPPLPLIAAAAAAHDGPVLLVGGALRDALLSRPPADIDIAVGGDLGEFLDRLAAATGRRPVAIRDHWRNTHRAVWAGIQVDVAELRGDVEKDLEERDFTINAMAVELGGPSPPALIDPHGGRRDLDARTIRMSSAAALDADPLRMLRAARYRATLRGFAIEAKTAAKIAADAAKIADSAAERIQGEWSLLLEGDEWARGVEVAYELGLGERTLVATRGLDGVAAWAAWERAHGASAAGERLSVRLAAVLAAASLASGGALQRRLVELRWPVAVARRAARIGAWAADLAGAAADILVDRALEDPAAAAPAALLARAIAVHRGSAEPPACEQLELWAGRAAEERWVSGDDLRRWGMREGPQLGALLARLARGQLQRRWPSAEGARDWARRQAEAAAEPAGRGA